MNIRTCSTFPISLINLERFSRSRMKNCPLYIHSPVRFQGAESDVAIPTIFLNFLVERAVGGGGWTGGRIAGRGWIRWWYRWWCRRCRVHPHVAVQRHFLIRAVRTMRTRVRLPHLVFAGLVVILVVRRVLL